MHPPGMSGEGTYPVGTVSGDAVRYRVVPGISRSERVCSKGSREAGWLYAGLFQ